MSQESRIGSEGNGFIKESAGSVTEHEPPSISSSLKGEMLWLPKTVFIIRNVVGFAAELEMEGHW